MVPKPPALLTAATSFATPTHCMPPCIIGYMTPVERVKKVSIIFIFEAKIKLRDRAGHHTIDL